MYVHITTVMNWQGEPSTTKNSSSSRAPKNAALSSEIAANCQKMGAHRDNVDFQRANRAERSCNQKHRLCTLLHSAEWRANASGFEFTATGKICKFFQSPRRTCVTVEPSEVHAGSPENSNTLCSTGNTQTPE